MRAFTAARTPDSPDEIWLTEHDPVYTFGIAGRPEHLHAGAGESATIPVVRSDRGGQVTYHGPGQVVLYTLMDLRRLGLTVRPFVERLETAVIDCLGIDGITATGDRQRPGVYVDGAKIAALGLKVSRGCTYHGLAFNADPDLAAFDAIDPCGHAGLAVTSARRLGLDPSSEHWGERIAAALTTRLQA